MLIASLDQEAQEDLRANKNLGVYKGALYENFVAEAFVKQGLGLYYYKKEKKSSRFISFINYPFSDFARLVSKAAISGFPNTFSLYVTDV